MCVSVLKSTTIKNYLEEYLNRILSSEEARESYFINPSGDFTRDRKLSFADTVKCMIVRSTGTLNSSLTDYFGYGEARPSKQAFTSRLKRIKPDFWIDFYEDITSKTVESVKKADDKFKGYRLIAIDGTDLAVPEFDEINHTAKNITHGQISTYNSIHINAAVDVLSSICIDIVLQHGDSMNEAAASVEMVKAYNGSKMTVFVCDRGYPSYNLIANIIERGMYFLIRDGNSLGRYWWDKLSDGIEEGTVTATIRLTRANSSAVQESDLYHFIPLNTNFDFLPEKSPLKQGRKKTTLEDIDKDNYYEMTFRIVRTKIASLSDKDEYEILITNLPEDDFSAEDLKEAYHLRWNIETFFRELKHDDCLTYVHAKRTDFIVAEIYARLIMHNITAILVAEAMVEQKNMYPNNENRYSINHTDASRAVRIFLYQKKGKPKELIKEMVRNLSQVKDGRSFPRKLSLRGFVGFHYHAS